jgi:hypothetical protein
MLENEKLKKELEQYAQSTSLLFSKFRIIFYASVMKKMLGEILEKKTPAIFTFKLNSTNMLYLIPTPEKLMLIFGINFIQKTDQSLAKVFLAELEDSKRHVKNSVESKNYPDTNKPPIELKDIEPNPKKFSNGFVAFSKNIHFLT